MESIWSQSCNIKRRPPLEGDLETEVAVIGAGMAGVLIAYALQKAGKEVVVLEANRIASGQTRNTTAKITAQHGLLYRTLTETLGAEAARQYALANEEALQAYRDVIRAEEISCDFEETCAYVYGEDVENLKAEAEAAKALGLPASYTAHPDCPFPAAGAVKFEHQAQFHPLKFIGALAEKLTVYENTSVQTVEGGLLTTNRGTVRAKQVVFACHYPFVNFPGMYFAKMHQERSYVLALQHAGRIDGMFLGAGDNSYSLRSYGDFLLLGGGSHRTGENSTGGRYDMLRKKARELFPDSREVARWSAQDCITPDSVPYIGTYAPLAPDWYVATGFQKWGMTTSMAAALLLREQLCGRKHPCAGVFDPARPSAGALSGLACEGGQAVKGLTRQLLGIPEETAKEIPAGHGGVVLLDGEKVGVYKDKTGKLYAVDVRCPHLGCQVEWNPDEKSWDCPCHGSRFDAYGKLISGPAQKNIALE